MQRFIIFVTTVLCLVLSSEARSFRGGLTGFLKGQDPTDIGGNPEATAAEREGDIRHISAYTDSVAQTAEIIQRDLTNGLRADFPFLKSALTTFADDDGIVREGIYFCGNNNTETPFTRPVNYSSKSGVLGSEADGFGYVDTFSATQEIRACGRNLCEAGSFIDILANRIRSLGYHVQHADLCQARASKLLDVDDFPTGRTCMLEAQTSDRTSYSCNATRFEHGLDFYQVNRQCFGLNVDDCSVTKLTYVDANGDVQEHPSITPCVYDQVEKECRAENAMFSTNLVSATIGPACTEKVAEKIAGSTTVNVVRRAPSYSVKENGKVEMDDAVFVTGAPAGNCKSLRNYVIALNGNAMISAFRDDNMEQAEAYWLNTLKEARSFVKSYAAVLKNFREISVNMFPEIEYEEFEECAVGETDKNGYDSGNRTNPMCDDSRFTDLSAMNLRDRKAQLLLRQDCFCRAGTLNGAYVAEADDIYLRPDLTANDCTALENELPSVYQYCKGSQFSKEEKPWEATLKSLLPQKSRIHVFGDVTTQTTTRNKIHASLTDRIKVEYSCGRTVNADNNTFLYSNKGGNCMPFSKLHEVLYKLEFGTSRQGVGESEVGQDNTPTEGVTKFENMFCLDKFQLSNTEFSFRQLAYKWNHAQTKTDDGAAYEPRRDDVIYTDYRNREDTAQIVVDRQRFTTTETTDFCFIDWNREFAGSSDRHDFAGTRYQNPYDLFSREVDEAIFGAQVAKSAKARVIEDNALLWAAIEEELTSQSESRIAYQISVEAAEHFMRIVTTDTDGKDIKLDGNAAPAANKNVSETDLTGVAT